MRKRKRWTKKGKRQKIAGQRRKGLNYVTKERYVDFLEKGDGEGFYEVLKQFYQELKYKWAGEDKNIDDFEKE